MCGVGAVAAQTDDKPTRRWWRMLWWYWCGDDRMKNVNGLSDYIWYETLPKIRHLERCRPKVLEDRTRRIRANTKTYATEYATTTDATPSEARRR
jgi:hypothetical protein